MNSVNTKYDKSDLIQFKLLTGFLIVFFFSIVNVSAQDVNPVEILKSLNYSEKAGYGLELYAKMTDYQDGKEDTNLAKLRQSGDNAFLEFIKPASRRGDKILLTKGRYWYLKKGASNPLAITPRMQLIGQASVGDILMINYSKEYDPVSIKETVYQGQKSYLLDLRGKKEKNPAYDRISYTLLAKERTGVYAEYFTMSGKMLKKAEFRSKFIKKHSVFFFSKVIIYDGIKKDNRTEIEYSEPEIRKMPSSEFDRNILFK